MARSLKFANNQIYHIYNRGVRKSDIFLSKKDYQRWEKLLYWSFRYDYSYSKYLFRLGQAKKARKSSKDILEDLDLTKRFSNPPVEILAYIEMPNHYHLILKQLDDNGITKFMHKSQTSYSKYFNLLHGFKGAVFESNYQAVVVRTDEQLLQLFRYLHTNPLAANLVTKKHLLSYPWSSLASYVDNTNNQRLSKEFLLRYFDNDTERLWKFTTAEYDSSAINLIQNLTHDDDFDWYQEISEQKQEEYQRMINKVRAY